jgi:hypothetical protein
VSLAGALLFLTGGAVGAMVHPTWIWHRRPEASPTFGASGPSSAKRSGAKRVSLPDVTPALETQIAVVADDTRPASPPALVVPSAEATTDQGLQQIAAPRALTVPPVRRLAKMHAMSNSTSHATPASTSNSPLPPPVTAPAPSPTNAVSQEQSLITLAMRKLRSEHDPGAALAIIDDHRTRFPRGVLAPEAARLRVEALLALGDKAAALNEIDQLSSLGPGNDESLVVRGELRAAARQWSAALEDFDRVVRTHLENGPAVGLSDEPRTRGRVERALWGRATSRSHLGDFQGARNDLHAYLHHFPDGRLAAEAARLLGRRR